MLKGHTGLLYLMLGARRLLSTSAYNFLSLNTKQQICSLWQPSSDQVEFQLVNVQRQLNSSDCGLFAIANATELAHGRDTMLCMWDTCQMREHLFNCLEMGKIEQFPLIRQRCIPVGKHIKKNPCHILQDSKEVAFVEVVKAGGFAAK